MFINWSLFVLPWFSLLGWLLQWFTTLCCLGERQGKGLCHIAFFSPISLVLDIRIQVREKGLNICSECSSKSSDLDNCWKWFWLSRLRSHLCTFVLFGWFLLSSLLSLWAFVQISLVKSGTELNICSRPVLLYERRCDYHMFSKTY